MANEIPIHDYVLQQGEDSLISIIYKTGETPVAIDLTGYSIRMDARTPDGVVAVFTFNSDDADPDTEDEAVLGTNGEINITVDRALTLPGGALEEYIGQALNFDMFLRDPQDKQKKILKGTITFARSETLWP